MDKDCWLEELADFIVEANTKGWAAESAELSPIFPGMKSLYYKRGVWEQRDNFSGYFQAPGAIVISFKNVPVWFMTYFGKGQTQGQESIAKPTYTFLKKALMQAASDIPFRGPQHFEEGEWAYNFRLFRGNIENFLAEENVMKDSTVVFTQTIGGGIIIGKNAQREPVYPWLL